MKNQLIQILAMLGTFALAGSATADTIFNEVDNPAANILTATDWSNGLPAPGNDGTISKSGVITTFSAFLYGTGTIVNSTAGTIDGTATDNEVFNMKNCTWNMTGGNIVVRYFLINQATSFFNMSGGRWEIYSGGKTNRQMGVANDGSLNISGAAVLDATHANVPLRTDGTIDIASNWTGSWTFGIYTGTDWENHFTSGQITLDGAPLDLAGFEANFAVTDDGQTLQRGTGGTPEPGDRAILHHRYDGDFTDSNGEGNDGTASGAAAITTDPAAIATGSGALSLDGADTSYLTLDSTVSFTSTDPWSVTWWARRSEIGAQKAMVMGRRDNTSDFIWLNDSFTGLRFRSGNATTHDFTVAQDTQIHHYALVADGAGALSLYRDGQWLEDGSGDTSFFIDTIGLAHPTTTLHYAFQGSLDEVHIFNESLNAVEIEFIYNDEKPIVPSEVDLIRVFLLGGQSNGDGRANPADLPTSPVDLQQPQDDIDFYYNVQGSGGGLTTLRPGLSETSGFGPEITLGQRLANIFDHDAYTRTAIVKYANGGTNLHTQWKAGGDATTTGDGSEYVVFQQTVTDGLAALAAAHPSATIEIQGMVWVQGESDTANNSASYQANLTAFIADVRATYGADLPFIVLRLSIGQTALDATKLAVIRAAQDAVAAADPRTSLVDSDTFGLKGDNLHFDAVGQQQIGEASGEELVYLRWMLDTFPPTTIDASQADWDADYDGDGQSNGNEFIAGTLADDPRSFFSCSLTHTPPDQISISYSTATNRDFAIEQWDTDTNTWSELLPAERGSGGTDIRNAPSSEPRGFFRVRAQLP